MLVLSTYFFTVIYTSMKLVLATYHPESVLYNESLDPEKSGLLTPKTGLSPETGFWKNPDYPLSIEYIYLEMHSQ